VGGNHEHTSTPALDSWDVKSNNLCGVTIRCNNKRGVCWDLCNPIADVDLSIVFSIDEMNLVFGGEMSEGHVVQNNAMIAITLICPKKIQMPRHQSSW